MQLSIKDTDGQVAGTIDMPWEQMRDEIREAHLSDSEIALLQAKAERLDEAEKLLADQDRVLTKAQGRIKHLESPEHELETWQEYVSEWADQDFYNFWEEARKAHPELRPIAEPEPVHPLIEIVKPAQPMIENTR